MENGEVGNGKVRNSKVRNGEVSRFTKVRTSEWMTYGLLWEMVKWEMAKWETASGRPRRATLHELGYLKVELLCRTFKTKNHEMQRRLQTYNSDIGRG